MIQPDETVRHYSSILPDLKQLGYHADLKPGYPSDGCAFTLTVSRHDDALISRDGAWRFADGTTGTTPVQLLTEYRRMRLDEAWGRLRRRDRKGVARDLMELAYDTPIGAILDVDGDREHWRVEYRPQSGGVEQRTLDSPWGTIEAVLERLERAWA